MSDKPESAQSWWQTIPGILTGIAAVVTAVTGLIVTFNHDRGTDDKTAPSSSQSVAAGGPARSPTAAAASNAAGIANAQQVAIPSPNPLKLDGGSAVITLLSAQVEPIDAERRSLKLHVRYTNAGRYPANFWSSSYRLIVDDVPRAPTNLLDEVVDGDSAKEGDVLFELPIAAKDVVLQITAGEDKSRVPLKLP
jgi:hypothetical protein